MWLQGLPRERLSPLFGGIRLVFYDAAYCHARFNHEIPASIMTPDSVDTRIGRLPVHIPANVPAANFWSVVVYDPQTRSELQTGQPYPSKNDKRDKLVTNPDGSVDLTFGPTNPDDDDANWTQTVAGKGWFVILRLYGPLQPWFDKTWRPGEIEPIDGR